MIRISGSVRVRELLISIILLCRVNITIKMYSLKRNAIDIKQL